MWRTLASLVLLLLLAPVLPAQTKEEVIYPRPASVAKDTVVPTSSGNMNPRLLLVSALLAAAAGWWLWQKRRRPGGAPGQDIARLAISESRSLGSRQYLVVADYDGRKYLLGVCPGSIQMLTPLDPGASPPS